ncbi:hypothetical protein A0U40_13420 [[Bacillus] sp. KCTC 13219]|nr:hypothetical protein A0U40_13420 [[Bacillus] sp. KCTC 13219]
MTGNCREIIFLAYLKYLKHLAKVVSIDFKHREVTVLLLGNEEAGEFEFSFGEVELMEFTGLKDMNGKRIYSGHIIKQTYITRENEDGINYTGHHIGKVIITASKGVCMPNPWVFDDERDKPYKANQYKTVVGYRCEIIGNIHEHSHLLEVQA